MTTLKRRHRSAVILISAQNAVMANSHDRDAVVAAILRVVERARLERTPVVWVQHSDSEMSRASSGWAIVPELRPLQDEPVVDKSYGDAFEDTSLERVLAKLRVGRLVVAGAQTDAGVRATLHGAFVRGYDVTLVADGHTTEDLSDWGAPKPADVIAHTNLYWAHQSAPGRIAAVVVADEVRLRKPRDPRGVAQP